MSTAGRPPGRALLARRAAAASEPHAAAAARDVLERGNAVDAVIAGILAAAGQSATVFLGPLQLLVGGGGTGLVAMDGRVRQPGRGAPRPRGFLADEPVPAASRVGVSGLPATLAAASASLGSLSLLRAALPAIALAKARSAERAALIEAFARRGAQVLAEDSFSAELLSVAGRAARGLLTLDDLAEVRPEVVRFDERHLEPGGILTPPWRARGDHNALYTHLVAAADSRGMVAMASYEAPVDGLPIPALGLVAPPYASPVMRGQSRVGPGEARPAAAPMALRAGRGIVDLAIGVAAVSTAEAFLQGLVEALDVVPTVAEALLSIREGRVVAVVRNDDILRVLASA